MIRFPVGTDWIIQIREFEPKEGIVIPKDASFDAIVGAIDSTVLLEIKAAA